MFYGVHATVAPSLIKRKLTTRSLYSLYRLHDSMLRKLLKIVIMTFMIVVCVLFTFYVTVLDIEVMLNSVIKPGIFIHVTCRNNVYPKSNVARFLVPDYLVSWDTGYPEYEPPCYTASHISGQNWADPDIVESTFKPAWNSLDGNVNRVSYVQNYEIRDEYPLNPFGRTGLRGRGLLGRWGPNHAADPIVTRWKRDHRGNVVKNPETFKGILQMVAIQRYDNKMWAIPGGMVDPGEKVSSTLKREFMEEALNSFENKTMIEEFFSSGVEIYKGYVDDFRNTDNAWIETTAYNFHDDQGDKIGSFKLSAGDDAANVKWMDVNKSIKLHANHASILQEVAQRLNAHW